MRLPLPWRRPPAPEPPPDLAGEALARADAARDAGDLHAAARLYPAYLELRPEDAGVWVQLGNMQKDLGDPVTAESAYRRALALDAAGTDAAFQLGHVLRQQGRLGDARDAFALAARLSDDPRAAREVAVMEVAAAEAPPDEAVARAARLRREAALRPADPDARLAFAEALLGLADGEGAAREAAAAWRLRPDFAAHRLALRCGADTPEAEGEASAEFLLDMADLLAFLEATGRVTGIQRVQLGLIEGLLAEGRARTRLVFLADHAGPVWALQWDDAEALLRHCLAARPDPAEARALVAAARARARRVRLSLARAYAFAGNFWYVGDDGRALRARLREAGVRVGALVYDLIPVTHPQHVDAGVSAHFRAGLAAHAPEWDFCLTISRHTAREVARVLPTLGVAALPPIRPVPLAHRLNTRRPEPGDAASAQLDPAGSAQGNTAHAAPGGPAPAVPGDLASAVPGDLASAAPGEFVGAASGDPARAPRSDLACAAPGDFVGAASGDPARAAPGDSAPAARGGLAGAASGHLARAVPGDLARAASGDLARAPPGDLGGAAWGDARRASAAPQGPASAGGGDAPAAGPWPEAVADLRGQDFVLCVGTIESRKNHLALFHAWALLTETGEAPPPLILVGRPGWLVRDLLDQLAATRNLGGLIRVLDAGVSDPELEALYAACLFTVFPSFTEGWGLPVGESLAAGKLCLASTEGATPEAGEGFADPVDPYDVRGLAARIRHWSVDRTALAEAERRIREGFVPRGWTEVTADFLQGLDECLAQAQPPRPPAPLPELSAGAMLRLRGAEPERFALHALRGPWSAPEGGRCWLVGREGGLALRAPALGTLALRLETTPWAEGNTLLVRAGGAEFRQPLHPAQPVVLCLLAAAAGDVVLTVEGPMHPRPPEQRPIRLALSGLRHIPDAPPAPENEPLLFAVAREREEGGIEAWRALCRQGFGAAGGGGVWVEAGGAVLRFLPELDAPRRVRVQLALGLPGGAAGEAVLELGEARAALAIPELSGPLLAAVEGEARPGEALELRLSLPRRAVLRAVQWGGTSPEARLSMLEALLRPAAAAPGLEGRVAALEAALGAPPASPAARLASLLGANPARMGPG